MIRQRLLGILHCLEEQQAALNLAHATISDALKTHDEKERLKEQLEAYKEADSQKLELAYSLPDAPKLAVFPPSTKDPYYLNKEFGTRSSKEPELPWFLNQNYMKRLVK